MHCTALMMMAAVMPSCLSDDAKVERQVMCVGRCGVVTDKDTQKLCLVTCCDASAAKKRDNGEAVLNTGVTVNVCVCIFIFLVGPTAVSERAISFFSLTTLDLQVKHSVRV